jgi:MFS family permease
MSTPGGRAANPHHERRWAILAMLGIAQLMVILDATIVNIALPSAQKALGFSNENRQWVVTTYALAFGSLLLLGSCRASARARSSPPAWCWRRSRWRCSRS